MKNQTIREAINGIQNAITQMNLAVGIIREDCPHDSHTVMMYSWGPGRIYPSRICKWCDSKVGGITKEEERACWKEWVGPTVTGVWPTMTTTEE